MKCCSKENSQKVYSVDVQVVSGMIAKKITKAVLLIKPSNVSLPY
jgi:hypothetical protein